MTDNGIIDFGENKRLHHWLHNQISYAGIEEMDGDENVRKVADGHHAVTFGYTDYGGTELDAVCVRFLERTHADDPAVFVENTSYNGKNAVVFGPVADELAKVVDGDFYEIASALGMDGDAELTEYEANLSMAEAENAAGMIAHDTGTELGDEERSFISSWLIDNGQFHGGTLDYDYDDLLDAVKDEFGIGDDDEEADESTKDCVARIVRDKSSGVCSVLMPNGDTLPFNGEDSAMRFCKSHGLHLVNEGVEDMEDGDDPRYPTDGECTAVFVRERSRSIREKIDSCIALLDKAYPQKDEEAVAIKELLGLIGTDAEQMAGVVAEENL